MMIQNDNINNFTSTGLKFWKHPEQMNNYRDGYSSTIISCHVSPTSQCNLGCNYCSVKKRDENHIELPVIKDFVEKLITRGLKAVIITGGGEPTLYPQFNELVKWLKYDRGLSVGLITNGTSSELVDDWTVFSWIRVSVNIFKGWKEKIKLPLDKINSETIIGASFIDGGRCLDKVVDDLIFLRDKINATYIRVLPNCLLNKDALEAEHRRLDEVFLKYNLIEKKFFHQYKNHGKNDFSICHQAYFRPYLSEVDGGTVYPCDSIVLNDQNRFFHSKYQICKAENVLEFLDGNIRMNFTPCDDCEGCVFTGNLQLLDDWVKEKTDRFKEFEGRNFMHEDFV